MHGVVCAALNAVAGGYLWSFQHGDKSLLELNSARSRQKFEKESLTRTPIKK